MPLERFPAFVCLLVLGAYWCMVLYLGIRLRRKIGKGPNPIPRDPVSLAMRAVWYPAVFLQITHCARIASGTTWPFGRHWLISLPFADWSAPTWWLVSAAAACVVIFVCFCLTLICWRKMGKSWRIGIDRSEKLEFVSSGPYNLVRHPIYALRILLDLCAIYAVPTPFMAAVTGIDIVLMMVEAMREERYMAATHGGSYTGYMRRVGRFVPRLNRSAN